MTATLDTFTDAQARQLHILHTHGWRLHVTRRDEEHLTLHVTGTDASDTQVTGTIDPAGGLVARPTDPALQPGWVTVSRPADTTDTTDGRTV